MRYDDLISKNLITPSLANLLFDDRKRNMVIRSSSFPSIAFNVGLIYTAMIQASALARSIKNGTLLKDEGYPAMVLDNINRTWALDSQHNDKAKVGKPWVFSFLIQCANTNDRGLFGENAGKKITAVKNALLQTDDNSRHFVALLSEEDFIDYLSALKLLRSTEIDWENMDFVFSFDDGSTCSIACQPFICFWNSKKNIQSRVFTRESYVITSVCKGKQMGELSINLLPINCKDTVIETKQIYWYAAKDETIRMIYKVLGFSTDWLSAEKCWCDLAFMQKLARVTEDILPKYWGLRNSEVRIRCVKEQLAALFQSEAIKNDILSRRKSSKKLLVADIDNVLFGLFINYGVFKTMCEMFDESSNTDSGKSRKELFELFLDAFVSRQYITAEEKKKYAEECEASITKSINALHTKISAKNSSVLFKGRSLEIMAEWRAFTVLKSAGVRADNLFADKEAIYSIDDYFNMIQNTKTSITDDLKQVLRLLIEIYGALLENKLLLESFESTGTYINEDVYYSSMQRIRRENASLDLEGLFDRFISIAESAEGNDIIENILGRSGICSVDDLRNFKADILDAIEVEMRNQRAYVGNSGDAAFDFSKKFIFVSYSRENETEVVNTVNYWRTLGWSIYLDNERFKKGTSWVKNAMAAIRHENCAMVAFFASNSSLQSDPVADELSCANEVANERFKDDDEMRGRFIHTINLNYPKKISEMLRYIKTHATDGTSLQAATDINKILAGETLYSSLEELKTDKVKSEIEELLMLEDDIESLGRDTKYTDLEQQIAEFYTFLKYGDDCDWAASDINAYFKGELETSPSLSSCIYPIVASMKETRIHRDNITMVGYEMVNGSVGSNVRTNYILTTRPLTSPDDYYCIPHEARVGNDCSWMADPLLISYKRMMEK